MFSSATLFQSSLPREESSRSDLMLYNRWGSKEWWREVPLLAVWTLLIYWNLLWRGGNCGALVQRQLMSTGKDLDVYPWLSWQMRPTYQFLNEYRKYIEKDKVSASHWWQTINIRPLAVSNHTSITHEGIGETISAGLYWWTITRRYSEYFAWFETKIRSSSWS